MRQLAMFVAGVESSHLNRAGYFLALPFRWFEAAICYLLTAPFRSLWRWLDARSERFEKTLARKVIAVTLFPIFMIAGFVLGFELVERGLAASVVLVLMASLLVMGAIMAPLERLMPWSKQWRQGDNDSGVDVLMFFGGGSVLGFILNPLGIFLTAWLVGWIHVQLPPDTIKSFWPTALHPVLQVLLLIVVMDFFRYWYHRWMHENAFMWRWHSVHHSSKRLYWFNGMRSHPIEQFLSGLIWVVPYTLIQAPMEIVFVAGIISRVIGRFQHTNVDVELGPFEYIFSAPNNHRYHHAKSIEEGNSNYGGDVVLWDHLFGTFYLPKGKRPSDDIGVGGMPDYPQTWLGLMLAPFRIRMWRKSGSGTRRRIESPIP